MRSQSVPCLADPAARWGNVPCFPWAWQGATGLTARRLRLGSKWPGVGGRGACTHEAFLTRRPTLPPAPGSRLQVFSARQAQGPAFAGHNRRAAQVNVSTGLGERRPARGDRASGVSKPVTATCVGVSAPSPLVTPFVRSLPRFPRLLPFRGRCPVPPTPARSHTCPPQPHVCSRTLTQGSVSGHRDRSRAPCPARCRCRWLSCGEPPGARWALSRRFERS